MKVATASDRKELGHLPMGISWGYATLTTVTEWLSLCRLCPVCVSVCLCPLNQLCLCRSCPVGLWMRMALCDGKKWLTLKRFKSQRRSCEWDEVIHHIFSLGYFIHFVSIFAPRTHQMCLRHPLCPTFTVDSVTLTLFQLLHCCTRLDRVK